MSVDLFIPSVWSGKLLVAVQKYHVFAQPGIVNNDYEGDIAEMGDTVRIHGFGDITISSYTKNTDISAPQELTDAETTLTISQAKYFNFAIDDVDAAQMQPKIMNQALDRAAYNMNDVIDTYLAGFYTDAGNNIGSSSSWTVPAVGVDANIGTTMYDYIVHAGTLLDQQNVPFDGRWAVLAPWMKEMLIQDKRFSNYGTDRSRQVVNDGDLDGDAAPERNFLGQINGMNVYWSNNVFHNSGTVGASGSQDVALFGQPFAFTFAEGVTKLVAYNPPYRFADAVKGLHLYGAKVTRPYGLVAGYFQHP